MKEMQDIVRAFEVASSENKQTALATVVQVQGSSYRRPGARMLVTEDGQLTGAISGGCLEGDALRKARLAMAQQKKMLITYDTTDDDDAKLGVGLGCNGIIKILIEPIRPEDPANPVSILRTFLSKRQVAVLVTLFSGQNRAAHQPGTCLYLPENGLLVGRVAEQPLQEQLLADAREALLTQTSRTKTYTQADCSFTGFIEVLRPQVSLVVVGAGNDAIPVTAMAALLGWRITVIDGRSNYATAARFPAAHAVHVAKPEQVPDQLTLDAQTVLVLMTHNYNYELALLRQLLPQHLPYVGVLGPKKKLNRLVNELQEEGLGLSEAAIRGLYGPVGLDIGAETSEEIALSILSEIKAVLAQRAGGLLRERTGAIHAPVPEGQNETLLRKEQEIPMNCSIRIA
ncbi:XdhC family protein [Pontibacter beigongshangensis]|uniref:XdhC family protein n=1 Tax=Pontibacter beigongshangensis TaxID=2574733 RepID=UPI00164F6176|nr:XdhC/CoxI family protein [Pontibacter beigongshangensis]